MSATHWVLDGHTPVPATLREWGDMMKGDGWMVARSIVGDVEIITIFTGVNHFQDDGPPRMFESRISGGDADGDAWGWSTWDDAVAGHEWIVASLRAGRPPLGDPTLDDLDLGPTTPPTLTGAQGRRCGRHRWDSGRCSRCGRALNVERSRRGRTARSKGNRRERELADLLGGVKVGHHGGPEDVRVGMFVVQSKVRAAFPSWMWDELGKLPRTDGRIPLLIVTDAPGRGVRRRAIAIVMLDDWRDLHKEATP